MYGQDGIDLLFGNGGHDNLLGGKGNDTVRGGEGEDTASGQSQGTDKLYGEGGNDNISDLSYRCTTRCVDDKNLLNGGEGDDDLFGQNKLYGGPGDDTLEATGFKQTATTLDGGPGLDRIIGSDSPDTIYAQNGERDEINCKANKDTVYYDAGIDSVNPATCERRITQPPPE